MTKTIYLDMDGTFASLYSVEGWLEDLQNENPRPYEIAEKMVDEQVFLDLVEQGFTLAIISWLSKNGSKDYNKKVRKAKLEWLKTNYPNVEFSEIHIVKYGTPKYKVAKVRDSYLVDDEKHNRDEWKGIALEPSEIVSLIS